MLQCLLAVRAGPLLQHEQQLGAALRRIGDELEGDYQLQTYDCSNVLFC